MTKKAKVLKQTFFLYIKSHCRNMFGLIQGMLESPIPLKLQQMMLGKELFHATLGMLCYSSFLKAIYNRHPDSLDLLISRKHRKALFWSNFFRRSKLWFSKFLRHA